MAKPWIHEEVVRYLATVGIKGTVDRTGRKHDRVNFVANGKAMYKSCSRSPSDPTFTVVRAIGDVKRMLKGVGHKT